MDQPIPDLKRDHLTISQGSRGVGHPRNPRNTEALRNHSRVSLLYTYDAADHKHCVDLGGRRIIKKK